MIINLEDDRMEDMGDLFGNMKRQSFLKDWMTKVDFHLLTDMAEVKDYFKKAKATTNIIAMDLETDSLNVKKANIIGASFSSGENECCYVPFSHDDGPNISLASFLRYFEEIKKHFKWIFYNAKFDTEVLYFNGIELKSWVHFEDAMLCTCLYDSNQADLNPSLKRSSAAYLDRTMVEYKEVTDSKGKGKEVTFNEVDLESATIYAGADALNTRDLYFLFIDEVKEKQGFIYKLETQLIDVVREMERRGVKIDQEYFQVLEKRLNSLKYDLEESILSACKKVRGEVNLASKQEVGSVFFDELGIKTDVKTATGHYKVDEDTLLSVYKKTGHKVLKDYVDYSKLDKVINSYIRPFVSNPDLDIAHIPFKQFQVSTGRFAGGGGGKGSHYVKLNAQSVPGVMPKKLENVKKIKNSKMSNKHYQYKHLLDGPDGLYCLAETCEGCPFLNECEKEELKEVTIDPRPNIRRGFVTRDKGNVIFTIDFSGVELRMVTNITKEPKWENEFLNGDGDLHTISAMDIFQIEDRSKVLKDQRGLGKTINFLSLYGGGAFRLRLNVNSDRPKDNQMTEEESERILDNFWAGIPVIDSWRNDVWSDCKPKGYVQTAFGRIRPLPDIDLNPDKFADYEVRKKARRAVSQAKRKAISHKVQGSSADLMKIAMLRCANSIKKNGWSEDVFILLTVHDELVFECKKELAGKVIPEMVECMNVKKEGWKIPFETDIEYSGHGVSNWGMTEECRVLEDGGVYPTSLAKKASKEGLDVMEYIKKKGIKPLFPIPEEIRKEV